MARIVVAGDTTIDWFMFPERVHDRKTREQIYERVPQRLAPRPNWHLHSGLRFSALPGGTYLLGELIREATGGGASHEVFAPDAPAEIRMQPPDDIIHSNATLAFFRVRRDAEDQVLRIRESFGYIGPSGEPPKPDLPKNAPHEAAIVVLDDAGNAFRDHQGSWPEVISSASDTKADLPIVVHKMSEPIAQGPLWHHVRQHLPNRHIVLVNARDLRSNEGLKLSRALSWERTAKEFVFQVGHSHKLQEFRQCPYVVVLFDADGAVLYRGGDSPDAYLVFDPDMLEGGFAASIDGTMHAQTSVFAASLVASLATQAGRWPEPAELIPALQLGLARVRRFLSAGFEHDGPGLSIQYPLRRVFHGEASAASVTEPHLRFGGECEAGTFSFWKIELTEDLHEPDPHHWRILDTKTRNSRWLAAESVVLRGFKNSHGKGGLLEGVPVGRFGKLTTIDRTEIESLSSIRALMREYIADQSPSRPLCFGVFGPPGAGKSFGVEQVARSAPERLETLTFNVSQFHDYDDLAAALHLVRNQVLGGRVPFVFFDEFDSERAGTPLGWLQFFLAPMQDGTFRDRGTDHPIGKSIFAFAGGTKPSFDRFCHYEDGDTRVTLDYFQQVKGPDFVSRLRGYIDVMGPNRQGDQDNAFCIRRALVLRGILERHFSARHIFDDRGVLSIDPGVLRALLCVSEYKHGTRSIIALIDMCQLSGKDRFELSCLPSEHLLKVHVDSREFMQLALRERYQSTLVLSGPEVFSDAVGKPESKNFEDREAHFVDKVSRSIHEAYSESVKPRKTRVGQTRFDELAVEDRDQNRDAAEDLPGKLKSIECGLRIAESRSRQPFEFDWHEVYWLARWEHERFCRVRRLQGYQPGMGPDGKLHAYLVPWSELSDDIKLRDYCAIQDIPKVLETCGYEIYRMRDPEPGDVMRKVIEFVGEVLENMAKSYHEVYREAQVGLGIAAKPYEVLSDGEKQSNRDAVAQFPRNLARIGIWCRYAPDGVQAIADPISKDELTALAQLEHDRWIRTKIGQGFRYGPKRSENENPNLVPWDELSDEDLEARYPPDIRKKLGAGPLKPGLDWTLIEALPKILRRNGFIVVRES